MTKSVGKEIFNDLVALEKKFWDRADYSEDDITTLSNAMDFIEAYYEEFCEYFKGEDYEAE